MALPRVEVSIGITLNVGNYESVRAEARFGIDQTEHSTVVAWANCIAEAQAGLNSALDGVERMMTTRKSKPAQAPPLPARTATAVAGPRRAGR